MKDLTKEEVANLSNAYRKTQSLFHRKKTDDAYYYGLELCYTIMDIAHPNSIRISFKKLNHYKIKDSDKRKEYVIEEFKEEMRIEMSRLFEFIS